MKKIITILMAFVMVFTFAFTANAATNIGEVELMQRTIPEGAFLYKEGLYIVETNIVVFNRPIVKWELYSAEGWCFYDLEQPENYDEEGNLLPAEQRVYAQYMIMQKNEDYVTNNIISVPVEEGYEIVSVGSNNQTA
jgi:hypothetical protein